MKLFCRITGTIALLVLLPTGRATPVDFAYQFTATAFPGQIQTISGRFGGWFDPDIVVFPYNAGAMTWIDISFDGMTFSTANADGQIVVGTDFTAFQLGGITSPDDSVQLFWSDHYDFFMSIFDSLIPEKYNTGYMVYSTPSTGRHETNSVALTPISVADPASTGILSALAFGGVAITHAMQRRKARQK